MVEEVALGVPVIKPKIIGRYALFGEIASGGMATVHLGRLVGPVGFSRTVAIKRLHPQYAKDPEFVAMFLDEARLASRVQHPNVVSTLDVVNMTAEVFLVMEYVPGESLSRLVRNARKLDERAPPGHVAAILSGMLHGLHAAHEAKSERREPLNIVHRDISPQNVLVGVDGAARVLDFGVAKAAMRSHSTRDGQTKGKLSYMSPEQLNGRLVDRRTDLFAAGVVLWEALTGKRLFDGADAGEIFAKLLAGDIPEPKSVVDGIGDALNAVTMKALERDPEKRFQTAREFAIELEGSVTLASPRAVGEWVERLSGPDLARRARLVAEIESLPTSPEDLEQLEIEDGIERLEEPYERPSVSAVQAVTGRRSRRPPPPPRRGASEPDGPFPSEDRSSISLPGGSTSQVASLVLPQQVSQPPGSPLALKIGAAAACVAGGVLAFLLLGPGHYQTLSERSVVAGAPPPQKAPPTPVPPAAAPTPPASEPPKGLAPSPSAEPAPAESASSAPRGAAKRGAQKPAVRTEPAAPPVDCNPPFTVDSNGIRRLKPGCL